MAETEGHSAGVQSPGLGFIGTMELVLDDKSRLTISARFREELGQDPVLFVPMDLRCIEIQPRSVWLEYASRLHQAAMKDPRSRRFLTVVNSRAADVSLDKQGRIILPAALKALAGIVPGEVVVIGNTDRLQVWAPGEWAAFNERSMQEFESLSTANPDLFPTY